MELLPSSLSLSIISPAGPGLGPKLLKYSDGLIREFPSPFRLGNLGGMKGSTMWAPGFGAKGTKSSSFSPGSSFTFFLFRPLAISEGLRT